MSDTTAVMEQLNSYMGALAAIQPILTGAQLTGLLLGAHRSGILQTTQTPASVQDIAQSTGIPAKRVQDMCYALDAHGILIREGDCYQLVDQWRTLVQTDLLRSLEVTLNDALAKARALAHFGDDYWQMNSEDRLALARGSTFNPHAAQAVDLYEILFKDLVPELLERFRQGKARCLELGCGIAAGMNITLRMFPEVTIVAVDRAADVLAEARATAESHGNADRITFVHQDAREFREEQAFDMVFWSQFFYPQETREDTLKVAYHALKPGGRLMMPLLSEPSLLEDDLYGAAGKTYSLSRVLYGAWGVPLMGAEDVKAEAEAAGFVNAQIRSSPFARVIIAQRPADL